MAEYIEREALYAEFECMSVYVNDELYLRLLDVGKFFQSIPAADVAPVVHGKWIGLEYDGYADGCPVYDLWECSECGEEVSGEDVPQTHPFCRGCGARMDGE